MTDMGQHDVGRIVQQIRCILLQQPRPSESRLDGPELRELQEALDYLDSCMHEGHIFLDHLQRGVLDVQPPERENFLSWHLKELHSALRFLTWQADQVSNGDYSQTVRFLGDFSLSFNRMTQQLADREAQLKANNLALDQTAQMLRAVMDSMNEWILVCDQERGSIIYSNQAAQAYLLDGKRTPHAPLFLQQLAQYQAPAPGKNVWEYQSPDTQQTFRINSYELLWDRTPAYSHLIMDVTAEKARNEKMEGLAYQDELTGLYNRRFCMEKLAKMLQQGVEFSFCMVDLDGLKYANDNFGHESGDLYLKTVAAQMQQAIRSSDIACRIGGDEFVLILPDCALEVALKKMERLDQSISALSQQFPMSISYGVSHVDAGASISMLKLVEQADDKMYVLKKRKKSQAAR